MPTGLITEMHHLKGQFRASMYCFEHFDRSNESEFERGEPRGRLLLFHYLRLYLNQQLGLLRNSVCWSAVNNLPTVVDDTGNAANHLFLAYTLPRPPPYVPFPCASKAKLGGIISSKRQKGQHHHRRHHPLSSSRSGLGELWFNIDDGKGGKDWINKKTRDIHSMACLTSVRSTDILAWRAYIADPAKYRGCYN